jgi:hypothetical protein
VHHSYFTGCCSKVRTVRLSAIDSIKMQNKQTNANKSRLLLCVDDRDIPMAYVFNSDRTAFNARFEMITKFLDGPGEGDEATSVAADGTRVHSSPASTAGSAKERALNTAKAVMSLAQRFQSRDRAENSKLYMARAGSLDPNEPVAAFDDLVQLQDPHEDSDRE